MDSARQTEKLPTDGSRQRQDAVQRQDSIVPAKQLSAADALLPMNMLALQRAIGNRAVGQLLTRIGGRLAGAPTPGARQIQKSARAPVVQRLISAEMLMTQLGDRPHEDRLFGLKHMSTHYKPIIESLNAYHAFVGANRVENEANRADITFKTANGQRALDLLGAVGIAVAGYTKQDEKTRRIAALRDEVEEERALINQVAHGNFPGPNPTWAEAIAFRRSGMAPNEGPNVKVGDFTDRNLVGPANQDKYKQLGKGQINTVYSATYARTGGPANATFEGVLKQDVPEVTEGGADVDNILGIPAHHPKFAARNVAIYRLSRLLELDVIPETEFALQGTQLSTAMAKVKGESAVKSTEVLVTNEEEIQTQKAKWDQYHKLAEKPLPPIGSPGRADILRAKDQMETFNKKYILEGKKLYYKEKLVDAGINYNDPNLRKSLMNLQLLDAVAASGDRHIGNYMQVKNAEGQVTGVKGFDNDSALGARIQDPNALRGTHAHNVGLPQVVDRVVAQRILAKAAALPDQIREQMQGLLSAEEIQATIARVQALILHLQSIDFEEKAGRANPMGKFVDDWHHMTEQTLAMLNNPDTSYVGRDQASTAHMRTQGLSMEQLTAQGHLLKKK